MQNWTVTDEEKWGWTMQHWTVNIFAGVDTTGLDSHGQIHRCGYCETGQ